MLTLWRNRRGLAGVEFAIIAPLLVVMLLGMADLSRAYIMSRRLMVAADAVATIASTEAVLATSLGVLTQTQAIAATTAPFAYFPSWLPSKLSVDNSFSITLSEINFKTTPKCTSNCTYTANVFWSVANTHGQMRLRPCGTLKSVDNSSDSSLLTLPTGNYGQTSLFVADVAQTYTPLFTGGFLGSFTMQQSAYVSPRVNNSVTLQATNVANILQCPAAAL